MVDLKGRLGEFEKQEEKGRNGDMVRKQGERCLSRNVSF